MRWSALFLLAFVVYHLLDLTFGTVHPSFEEGDVYHNVIASFRLLPVSLVYIAAMLLLWPHLRHGVWSMLRTLGLGHPRYEWLTQRGGGVRPVVVAGNVSFPLALQKAKLCRTSEMGVLSASQQRPSVPAICEE
jgi:succinate dehydrogenase / fumarate reductase, cytochrome b subunit